MNSCNSRRSRHVKHSGRGACYPAVVPGSTTVHLGLHRPVAGNAVWGDLGMHFDKNKFGNVFIGSGIYQVDYVNNASLGGTNLEVTKATKVITFEDIAHEYLEENK